MIHSLLLAALLLAGPSAAARLTEAQAEALVREISASVEKIRGLRFKTPVAMKVIDGATARESFKSRIKPEHEAEIRATQAAYVHLGLVPKGTDLLAGYLDLAEKDVLGYYESGSKTFYLLDHVSPGEVRSVVAHELTHALEDQNYDLGKLQRAARDDDHALAVRSLIEGSATAVMLAFASRDVGAEKAAQELEKGEAKRAERLQIAPSFAQRSVLMPYVLGFTFLLRGKPWAWVTEGGVLIKDLELAYATPPSSSRHILHPEQYWGAPAKAAAQRLELPDLSATLGPGFSLGAQGSIGELGLAVLAGSRQGIEMPWGLLPERWTNEAAIGSLGDAFQHYQNGEQSVTVLLTRWESMRDAEQFGKALVQKGKYYVNYGANVLVLIGDVGDKGPALAGAALQHAKYWTN